MKNPKFDYENEISNTEDTPSDRFIIFVGIALFAGTVVVLFQWSRIFAWLLAEILA